MVFRWETGISWGNMCASRKGALNPYAEKMKQLVVELHKFEK